ncbi:hypothetical protein HmCmsJML240_04879 [Escherichia coli]|nr:hypothetical protein HmCmsJML240_04879 [Escherichia coli]
MQHGIPVRHNTSVPVIRRPGRNDRLTGSRNTTTGNRITVDQAVPLCVNRQPGAGENTAGGIVQLPAGDCQPPQGSDQPGSVI